MWAHCGATSWPKNLTLSSPAHAGDASIPEPLQRGPALRQHFVLGLQSHACSIAKIKLPILGSPQPAGDRPHPRPLANEAPCRGGVGSSPKPWSPASPTQATLYVQWGNSSVSRARGGQGTWRWGWCADSSPRQALPVWRMVQVPRPGPENRLPCPTAAATCNFRGGVSSPYPTSDGKGGQEWRQSRAGKPDGSLVKVQLCQGEVIAVMNRAESPLINADKQSSDVSTGKK